MKIGSYTSATDEIMMLWFFFSKKSRTLATGYVAYLTVQMYFFVVGKLRLVIIRLWFSLEINRFENKVSKSISSIFTFN